jgi:V-type H+-transporting ATPase subunit d
MNEMYKNTMDYGFTVSKMHGNAAFFLKEADYTSFQQCETLEDVLVKLSSTPYSKYMSKDMALTKGEFRKRLNKCMVDEISKLYKVSDKDLKVLLEYFINSYRIQNFFFLLTSKYDDPELTRAFEKLEDIGRFSELDTLKFTNDMNDVYKYCVERTFLKKYYKKVRIEKEIEKNNFQVLHSLFLKYHMEDFFEVVEESTTMPFMGKILKYEGDRRIIQITLSTFNSSHFQGKKRLELFPKVSTMGMEMKGKLGKCTTMDKIKGILSKHQTYRKILTANSDEMLNALTSLEMQEHNLSFTFYNDLSCVYSYFKMKQQEIKNILWAIECIAQDKREWIKNVIIPRQDIGM